MKKRRQRSSLLVWGCTLECCTDNLAASVIWRQVFWRTSIFAGCWFGVVWTGYPDHPFFKASILLFLLFIKPYWCKIASAARNWINSASPSSSDDLCLLFCIYPSSILWTHLWKDDILIHRLSPSCYLLHQPVVGRITAQLDVGPVGPRLQPGLGHLQRRRLVPDGGGGKERNG